MGQETTISPKTGDLVGLGVESRLPEAIFQIVAGMINGRAGEGIVN